MKSNARIILLDVGGTFVKSALGIAGNGVVEGSFATVPISSDGSAEEIERSFREIVSLQKNRAENDGNVIEAVCAALPGPFDYIEGIFLMKHKFAAVFGRSFREVLGEVIGPDVRLAFVHDVNGVLLGALSENPSLMQGNVALSTFGTGLGFAYAEDGKIQMTDGGSPAENLWNIPYEGGILEDFVSRRAILRFYTDAGGTLAEGEDVKDISLKARMGDEKAIEAFRTAGRHYAAGARELISRLGIRHLFFGGQISRSLDLMENEIRDGLGGNVQLSLLDDVQGTVFRGIATL